MHVDIRFGSLAFWKIAGNRKNNELKSDKETLLFINDIKIADLAKGLLYLSIFNNNPVLFKMVYGGFNQNMKLDGLCLLEIYDYPSIPHIGNHPMLKWRPTEIRGNFVDGILQGPTIIGTQQNNMIYGNFVNGVMHGPVFNYGDHLIYYDDYLVSNYDR